MRDTYEVVKHKGFNINIFRDDNAESPRDWGSLGTMYTMHRNYQPEKDFYKHFEWEEVFDENREFTASFEKKYIALKFYLYDHGGQSVSTSPFSCSWDSGLFGIIAVDIDRIRKEQGWKNITKERRKVVESWLKAEVEQYDQYLTGDVFGYTISECENEDNALNDSCWGFYGKEGIECLTEEAKSYIDAHLEDPKIIKRTQIFGEVKQFAKDLFTREGVEAELKLTY